MKTFLRENKTGVKTEFITSVEYCKTSSGFNFKFSCHDSKLFSAGNKDNDPIFKGDVVEVFMCTGGDLSEYYELEVAPNGTIFFALIKNDGKDITPTYLEKTFTSEVTITEKGYDCEIFIPFESVNYKEDVPVKFNAFRIETEGGIPDKNLISLNPTLCSTFHKPEKFIEFND